MGYRFGRLLSEKINESLIDFILSLNIIRPSKRREGLGQRGCFQDFFIEVTSEGLRHPEGPAMLHPAEKDIGCKADEGPTADQPRPSFPKETDDQRKKDDRGKKEVDDEDEVPGVSMFKKGGKDSGTIRGKKVEHDMADKNGETDLVITPEVGAPG